MQADNEKLLSINKRIIELAEYYGVTRYKLSKETGISQNVLHNIFRGVNKPGFDVIYNLLNKYTAINPDWLIRGTGEMLRTVQDSISNKQSNKLVIETTNICKQCTIYERLIAVQDDNIKLLKEKLLECEKKITSNPHVVHK